MDIRTVIVDDECLARDQLKSLLKDQPDISLVAEVSTVDDALQIISDQQPELLFLDLGVAAKNGFQALLELPRENLPCTIFTAAHDAYAAEAFSLRALDYLLKPVSPSRLQESIARARDHLKRETEFRRPTLASMTSGTVMETPPHLERLLVRINDRYIVVRAEDIEWIEAAANYVVLHTRAGNHVLRKTLSALEEELAPHRFFRASRSAIVNLTQVVEIQFQSPGDHVILLRSGARVPLTRKIRDMQERLQFAH